MKTQKVNFDQFYSRDGFYFSKLPSDGMITCLDKYNLSNGLAVDIGAGEGRNSIYLAERGFDVIAIEPNKTGADKIAQRGKERNLSNLTVYNKDFVSVARTLSDVDFVVALTSLEHMEDNYLYLAIQKIKDIMKVGSFVYIVVFTEDDPGFKKDIDRASECAMFIQHYFKHGELRNYFKDFEILEYKEYLKEDISNGPLHYHGKAKLFAKKIR